MTTVKVQVAKTALSRLLREVETGQEFTIARGNRPIAKLVPIDDDVPRDLGFVAYDLPTEFFDPLPEEELSAWEGAAQ